jgi:hypothetical protein
MLIFFHLLVGLILGLILTKLTKRKWLIPVCMVVSLLPDLIDKPLAFVSAELNSGRTVSHTLLFFGIVTVLMGLILLKNYRVYVIGISLSLILHQIADSMWNAPVTWFYPAFGPFIPDAGLGGHWFWVIYNMEISSPVEWVCGVAIVTILALILISRYRPAVLPDKVLGELGMSDRYYNSQDSYIDRRLSVWQVVLSWFR